MAYDIIIPSHPMHTQRAAMTMAHHRPVRFPELERHYELQETLGSGDSRIFIACIMNTCNPIIELC